MAKKQDLLKSFSSGSRKNKPSLSEAEIERIAEERAAEKKVVVPPGKEVAIEKQAVTPAEEKTIPQAVSAPASQKAKPARKKEDYKDEEVIKTSLDMPVGLYEDMKIYLIRQKKSMRQYILGLIEKDLDKKKR